MAIDLVSRAAWGARAPRGSYSRLTSTKGVKVHYTGGRVDPAIVTDHAKCVAMVKSIQDFHMDGNGWMDIGYSMIACSHRKVFVGRGPHNLPAANGAGLNSGHYAVLGLVGNSGLVTPPDGLLNAILDAIEYLRAKGGAGKEIKGHRDGYSTDCPGDALYAWVRGGAPRPGGGGQQPDPGSTPRWPGRLLKYPPIMRGEDVRAWQRRMAGLGYVIEVDGAYGPKSTAVCVTFQKERHLDPDGIVGPLTWNAAFDPAGTPSPPRPEPDRPAPTFS
ncbi:peptidoglycan recognition protein family protein [Microtetraspora malaysiensis]|uniref:peptidoglycan recognition protein family protein n=1 Tax=Microtetraspora malaysiensis TaxID=161358 RepID=UPI003D91253E